jgi:DNA-binding transcriptional ArsR family regulator
LSSVLFPQHSRKHWLVFVIQFFDEIFSAAGEMKSEDTTLENKAKIMCWAAAKVTTKEIGACLGVHPSTIRRHLAVLKELPSNASPPPT